MADPRSLAQRLRCGRQGPLQTVVTGGGAERRQPGWASALKGPVPTSVPDYSKRVVPVAYCGTPWDPDTFKLVVRLGGEFAEVPFRWFFYRLSDISKSVVRSWPELWPLFANSYEEALAKSHQKKSLRCNMLGTEAWLPLLAYSFRGETICPDYDLTGADRNRRYYIRGVIGEEFLPLAPGHDDDPTRYGVFYPDGGRDPIVIDQFYYDTHLCVMRDRAEGAVHFTGAGVPLPARVV